MQPGVPGVGTAAPPLPSSPLRSRASCLRSGHCVVSLGMSRGLAGTASVLAPRGPPPPFRECACPGCVPLPTCRRRRPAEGLCPPPRLPGLRGAEDALGPAGTRRGAGKGKSPQLGGRVTGGPRAVFLLSPIWGVLDEVPSCSLRGDSPLWSRSPCGVRSALAPSSDSGAHGQAV